MDKQITNRIYGQYFTIRTNPHGKLMVDSTQCTNTVFTNDQTEYILQDCRKSYRNDDDSNSIHQIISGVGKDFFPYYKDSIVITRSASCESSQHRCFNHFIDNDLVSHTICKPKLNKQKWHCSTFSNATFEQSTRQSTHEENKLR